MAGSEIAHIRQTIANEYMAAMWGLTGFASGISRHAFITARMEKMGEEQQQLAALVGEQRAGGIVANMLMTLPKQPERHAVLDVLTYMRGDTEKTAYLTDHIREMWETIDLLIKEFGEEDAQKIIRAPGISCVDLAV